MKNMNFEVLVVPKVMKPDGTIVEYPKRHNLILNSGLEALATHYTADCFLYAGVGIGTPPTFRASGTITVSKTGATITASASFFSVSDVGKTLKFMTSGTIVKITSYVSVSQVACDTSGTESTQLCKVFNTTETGLDNLTKSSSTYYYGDGLQNGSSDTTKVGSLRVLRRWRTFEFTVEAAPITYTEAGWSWGSPASTNLFGRIVFSEGSGDITVIAGEKLLLYVELNTYIDTSVVAVASIPAIEAAGTSKFFYQANVEIGAWSRVAADGTSDNTDLDEEGYYSANEPFAGDSVAAFALGNAAGDNPADDITELADPTVHTVVTAIAETYVANSYAHHYIAVFPPASTFTWWDIRWLLTPASLTPSFRLVFDASVTYAANWETQLIFKKSWGRYGL